MLKNASMYLERRCTLVKLNLELVIFYRKIDVKRNNLDDYFHNLS